MNEKFKDWLEDEYGTFLKETVEYIQTRPDVMNHIKMRAPTDVEIDDEYIKNEIVSMDLDYDERMNTAREQGYIQAMRDVMRRLEE